MTIKQIINDATQDPERIDEDGSIHWNFVDYGLWIHPESEKFTEIELKDGLNNFSIKENIID